MDDIMGVPLKKFIEFVLALVGLVLALIDKMSAKSPDFILFAITLAYLSLIVIMACLKRDIGACPPIEGALGVHLLITGIMALFVSHSTMILVAYILYLVVGGMFLIFLMF